MLLPLWYSCTKVCAIGDYYIWLLLLPKWLVLLPLEVVWAGVIALWLMLLPLIIRFFRLMLLPYGWCYCHLLFSRLMLLPGGWCYCHHVVLADVIAFRLMELSIVGVVGRWNSHWVNALVLILLFCVIPHPIYVADGICQYFCWGMGHWPLWTEPLWLPW